MIALFRSISDLLPLGGWRSGTAARADGGVRYVEVSSLDAALALCADALRPDVTRVEVRLGRELAGTTNPADFRTRADRQARAYVREGSPIYSLSVDWADPLQDGRTISVKVLSKATTGSVENPTVRGRNLTAREVQKIRQDIVGEFEYAVRNFPEKSAEPLQLAAVTVVCRDTDVHAWIAQAASDQAVWSRAFENLAHKHGLATRSGFTADFRFEQPGPGTRPVGEGDISIELHKTYARPKPEAPSFSPTSPEQNGTFDISDAAAAGTNWMARVTFLGLGNEILHDQAAVALPLPGVVDRLLLSRTALGRDALPNLQVVSQTKCPLHVGVEDGKLTLQARVKRAPNGEERASHFLVDPQRGEIPLIGKTTIVADPGHGVEILIGAESEKVARAPDGSLLRPVRIRVELELVARQP